MNIQGPVKEDALRLLQEIPGVVVEPRSSTEHRPDVVIRAGDVTHVIEIKAQRLTNAAAARQLAEYARGLPSRTYLLVVARTTTADARRLLEEHGVGVIDTHGNMRVELPGLFLWTEGKPGSAATEERNESPVRLSGKAGVAAQALLLERRRRWQVNDLAKVADVSVGLAHRVLARLERENLVQADGVGPKRTRRLENPAALLDLWAEEMQDRRVKHLRLFRLARDPRVLAAALSDALVRANIEHAISGPAGAAPLAPFVTAIPVTDIWVADTLALDDAADAAQADTVQEGHNIVLRQVSGNAPLAFRTQVNGIWTVNQFRLYFDLRQDPRRGREQADRLREEVIGF